MTPTKIALSPKQQKIVYAEERAIYVKASAGSGKTRVLTERIRYLLSKTKKKILALTFTNKAAEEIKQRLTDINDIDSRLFTGTFHGFCQHVLENHGSLLGFSKMPHIFEEEADRLELIGQAILQTPSYSDEYKNINVKEQQNLRYRALNFVAKVKRKLIASDEVYKYNDDENVVLLYLTYEDILRSQNAIDFDDLIRLTYELFTNYPNIAALYRRSFHAICVDEAQDLNNAQYKLLQALANGEFKNIMMVGDSNQSIFHFNGSSPDFMDQSFVKDFDADVVELKENYRSSKAVLSAAKKIRPENENISDTVKTGIFEIHALEDEQAEAQWITDKIQEWLAIKHHDDIEGEICPEKIAVLARNKYVFNALEQKFKDTGISYYFKMTPGAIKFESELMKLFDLAFRIKINPQDVLHKERLLKMLNCENSNLENLAAFIKSLNPSQEQQVLNIVNGLADDGSNLKESFIQFKNGLNIIDENERSMVINDIDELLNHWLVYAKSTDNKSLHYFKNAMALGQTHPLTQHQGITLSTVHTMKGQEFDIVFLMGMDDETFPDYRAIKNNGIQLTQEHNNLYVAFTRAKRFLYVTWPEKRQMPWGVRYRKISRFLN
ncbi:MAG: ATP-dependent helicase [Methylovulum miyakonense]|uniref:ATP-dependent helicase n=1 Tax=Methylovulum miyakonense TaxID=645578 RepID=UPI003BB4D140